MSDLTHDLLRVLIRVSSQPPVAPDELQKRVTGGKPAGRSLVAFNLCDGKTAQGDIANKAGIDAGNFSRMVSRWEKLGVVFRIGDHPLHLYRLPEP
jgi:hypothetical protein